MHAQRTTTPLERRALIAALSSPTHSLQRTRAGYVPAGLGANTRTSRTLQVETFTYRLVSRLERGYLVNFDDAGLPSRATLTEQGLQLARTLAAADAAKAGVA
ncbi:hypothetical protein [Marilutibacter alkalisoli]|uniref:Transcriptional regulator n=1 Tax=Marilutibacter alkalisoli TaxID=2591633 RepID=A0A514BTY8_9GAMM|nr:hypothetical protein [Lysobacter alkalisoli]QDH70874.1 hypothetical protein FKV23_12855 [Lysobacter alkalisoli]